MKHDKLTRRQALNSLAAVGVGMAASPLLSPLAAAAEIGNSTRMVAAIFFESYATIALRRALRYAGDDGFVASMPALLRARMNAEYDNIIWNTWFSAYSEENVLTTPQGNHVVARIARSRMPFFDSSSGASRSFLAWVSLMAGVLPSFDPSPGRLTPSAGLFSTAFMSQR